MTGARIAYLLLSVQAALIAKLPGARAALAQEPPSGRDAGAPVVLVRGCAGIALFGSHFCGGIGAGWNRPQLEVGLLAGYSRIRSDHIVFGPGERYALMHSFEGSAWVALRHRPDTQWRVATVVGLGRRNFTFHDFSEIHRRRTLVWSAAAGPGFGPAFVLLGMTGPAVTTTNSVGLRLRTSIVVHVSLNVVLDVWGITKDLKAL